MAIAAEQVAQSGAQGDEETGQSEPANTTVQDAFPYLDEDEGDVEFENDVDDTHDGSARTTRSRSINKVDGNWARIVAFNIFIVNSMNKRLTIGKRSINEFRKNEEWGWGDFVAMSKLEEAGFVMSDKQEESEDPIADGEERAAREREREKVAALEEIKESPPDEYGTLTIETFVVVSDPSEGKVTVEELLRTFISGVFSSNPTLQGVCLGKMDELLQMHSSPTSILGPMSDESHTYQHEADGKKTMLDPCPNAKLRAIIRKRGCIGKILALLHDSTLDIELRVSAAGILQTLAFNDYNDDKAIIDAGGVPILLAALAPEAHGENKRTRVDLQVCAAGTLLNLQLCKESSHIVLKEGGVAICIELLRAQTDIDLLQEVAGVIANAAVCEEDGAVIVSRLGGIAPLMKHLQPSEDLNDSMGEDPAVGRYTNIYPRPSDAQSMDPTVLQLNSAIALQFAIRNSPSEFGAKDMSAYVPTLKKMWKHASIVQKCCAGIILVELSFFVSPGTKFVTKRDIAWLLSLVNSDDIDEGVLLGVLKLIGGLCETNYGKARKWIRALDGVTALLKLICATDSQNAQWFAAHTLNGLSLFDYAGAKRIAECTSVELPEPAAELLVEPGRDLKDRKSLPSLEILLRLLKSNNGGPRVAACDALSNLVLNYPSCRDTLRSLGLIGLVRDIMESSTHATLQFIAASTLACLIGSRSSFVPSLSNLASPSFTFPSPSYPGSGSFTLPSFSFFLSPSSSSSSVRDSASSVSPPPSSPDSESLSAPTSPTSRTRHRRFEEESSPSTEEKQRTSTRDRKLASFFSSPSFFPVARSRSSVSILDNKDFIPHLEERSGRAALTASSPCSRRFDEEEDGGQEYHRSHDHHHNDQQHGKDKELHALEQPGHHHRHNNGNSEASTVHRNTIANGGSGIKGKAPVPEEEATTDKPHEASRRKYPFRRGTLYAHELELMKGKKGLRGMLHELVHTKNREVQFQAIKGIGTLGSMDQECLEVILAEDEGRAIAHLGKFLECTNFMLLRVAAFSLYCLCSTAKAREVSHLIIRHRITSKLKSVAANTRDVAAKALAKKTLKLVKKYK